MRCILVFDHLNDIIFSKCDHKFVSHIKQLGSFQGMDTNGIEDENGDLDINFVIQLFSPIVTSQRIMSSQFGNSYTSIQCQDGLNIVFDEYLGFLFVHIGFQELSWLKRVLGVCMSIMQHLCGPDISVLKTNRPRNTLVGRLLDTWSGLANEDQGFLLEAIEQLTVNPELNSVAIKALSDATDRMKSMLDQPKSHALLFVGNKFLALYSSKSVRELSASDLLFLSLMSVWCQKETSNLPKPGSRSDSSCSEFYSPDASPKSLLENGPLVDGSGSTSDLILLSVNDKHACSPNVIHISPISEGVTLILLYQTVYESLSVGLIDTFNALHSLNVISMSNTEIDGLKKGIETLEPASKKVYDAVKKLKSSDVSPKIEASMKLLNTKWETLKKQWSDYKKGTATSTSVLSCCQNMVTTYKDLLRLTVLNRSAIPGSQASAHVIRQKVSASLAHIQSFLQAKALRNFTLGSRDYLNINKYLEGFPGLVHFIYVDRVNHRIIAPSYDFENAKPDANLTKQQVWGMVDLSRIHLQEGHLAIMWRDQSFCYAYYLWFEDMSGSPLQPKVSVPQAMKTLPLPGVISSDFYQRLIEICFPRMTHSKIKCFELYCIHLGVATSSCVLEHSHRLASTIYEVSGIPSNPLDIL